MPHLVLADENPTTQRVFELALSDEEVEISCCDSGAAALDLLELEAADILFAHVALPDIPGYELSRRVKCSQPSRDITVVLLVGAFQSFDQEKAGKAGCIHHLSKPFETSSLVKLVRELLANPPRVEVDRPFVFEIPASKVDPETLVFKLDALQCRPAPQPLEREIRLPRISS